MDPKMPLSRLLAVLLLVCLPGLGHAASPPKEEAPAHPFQYIELKPGFTVSFGTSGRVGYLKAGISLRVANAAAPAVELHMPAIRHELIMFFSAKAPEVLVAADKREGLRTEALEKMRKLLEEAAQVKPEEVEDLLFTEFFTQR
jgi:flagellar basal body-associated protein FliL